MPPSSGLESLLQFVPLMILGLGWAIGAAYIAPKIGASRVLWFILLVVPVVNIVAGAIFFFRVAGHILDRLNALTERSTFS